MTPTKLSAGLYRFCDASHWQGNMDWTKAQQRLDFAYAKASQGVVTDTVTPSVTRNPTVTATEDYPTVTQTPEVRITLTASLTPIATMVLPVVSPVAPTYTVVYRTIRECAPRWWWEACYWRCCR